MHKRERIEEGDALRLITGQELGNDRATRNERKSFEKINLKICSGVKRYMLGGKAKSSSKPFLALSAQSIQTLQFRSGSKLCVTDCVLHQMMIHISNYNLKFYRGKGKNIILGKYEARELLAIVSIID